MKHLSLTLCLAVSVLALSACETSTSTDAGANYAASRTAGEADLQATKSERAFSDAMAK